MKRHGLTRRELMRYGGVAVTGAGGLALAGIGGYAWPHAAAASIAPGLATPDDTRGVLHFVSRPDLNPPAVTVARHSPAPAGDPPYFILAPQAIRSPGRASRA